MDQQVFNIPLDAPIDVASTKMFTPVAQPKHLYNSQQYHNGVLQNSLRYEHNGYAAGKYVYEFNLIDGYTITMPELYTVHKYKLNDIPSYKLAFAGTDKYVIYNTVTALLVENNTNGIAIKTVDADTTLTGYFNDIPFSFTYNSILNSVEEEMDRFDVDVIRNTNKTTTFNIKDMQNTVSVDLDALIIGQDMLNDSYRLAYFEEYKNDKYVWTFSTLTFEYNSINHSFKFSDNNVLISSGTAIIENGAVIFSFNKEYKIPIQLSLASETASKYLFNASEQRKTVLDRTLSADMGANICTVDLAEQDYLYASNTADPNDNDTFDVGFDVPVWFSIDDREIYEDTSFVLDTRNDSVNDYPYVSTMANGTLSIPMYELNKVDRTDTSVGESFELGMDLNWPDSLNEPTLYGILKAAQVVRIDKTAPKLVTRYATEFYGFSYPEVAEDAPFYPYNIPFGTTPFVFDINIKCNSIDVTYTVCFCLQLHYARCYTYLNTRPSAILDDTENQDTMKGIMSQVHDTLVSSLPYMLQCKGLFKFEQGNVGSTTWSTLASLITNAGGAYIITDRTFEFTEYSGFGKNYMTIPSLEGILHDEADFYFPCKRINNWRLLYNSAEAEIKTDTSGSPIFTACTLSKDAANYTASHLDTKLLLPHATFTPPITNCFSTAFRETIIADNSKAEILAIVLRDILNRIDDNMHAVRNMPKCKRTEWEHLGLEDFCLPLYTRIPQTINATLNTNIIPGDSGYVTTDVTAYNHKRICNILSGLFSNRWSRAEYIDAAQFPVPRLPTSDSTTGIRIRIVGIYPLKQQYQLQYKHEFFNSTLTNINQDFIVKDKTDKFNDIFKFKSLSYDYMQGASTLALIIKDKFYVHSIQDVVYTQLPLQNWILDIYRTCIPNYLITKTTDSFVKEASRTENTDIAQYIRTSNWYACIALNSTTEEQNNTTFKCELQLVAPELTYFIAQQDLDGVPVKTPVTIEPVKIYNHHFKNAILPTLDKQFSISVGPKTMEASLEKTTVTQAITCHTNSNDITFKYTAAVTVTQQAHEDVKWSLTETLVPMTDTKCNIGDYVVDIQMYDTVLDTNSEGQNVIAKWSDTPKLTANVDLVYNLHSLLPTVTDAKYTLNSCDDNVYAITAQDGYTFKYNSATGTVNGTTKNGIAFTTVVTALKLNENVYRITFDYVYTLPVNCTIEGPFMSNVQLKDYKSNEYIVFTQDYKDYKIDLKELFDSLNETQLQVTSTNVTTQKTQVLKTIDCDNTSQVLTQLWDSSTDTDAFWWINDTHTVKLEDTRICILQKQNTVTDWAGDSWLEVRSYLRDQLIPDAVKHYDMTCAKNTDALFYTLEAMDLHTIKLKVYNLLTDILPQTYTIPIYVQKINETLNNSNTGLNTYSYLTADILLASAKFSATHIGRFLLLGIHQDKNFNQWTVCINLDTNAYYVVQGYGFVGIDGTITGGEIPEDFFNVTKGFNSYVQDISTITDTVDLATKIDNSDIVNIAELYNMEACVIGTDKQQWYVTKKIDNIVSHCTFNKHAGTFNTAVIPLNNNYDTLYASASFLRYVLGDSKPSWEAVANLLNEVLQDNQQALNIWKTIWRIGTYPFVLLMKPRVSYINYLQQTLGQYAYVHRNSTKYKPDAFYKSAMQREVTDVSKDNDTKVKQTAPVSEDELSFDIQTITQEIDPEESMVSDGLPMFFKLALVQVALELIKSVPKGISELVSDGTLDGTVRSLGQNFAVNAVNLLSMNNSIQSLTPALKSRVTALKTLDMFYSTSALQNVHAGPGYVNHNFVAQCIAQSTTATQVELSQMQLYYLVKEFALWQIDLIVFAEEKAVEAIDSFAQVPTGGDISYAAAAIVYAGLKILRTVATIHQVYMKALRDIAPSILDGLGGDKLRANLVAGKSHHDYNIEGKHTYGNKTETFMWPCKVPITNTVNDESVSAVLKDQSWSVNLATADSTNTVTDLAKAIPPFVTHRVPEDVQRKWVGDIPLYIVGCRGTSVERNLPEDMACVIGTHSFLSPQWFKNENINESEPVFATPVIQDYIVDETWDIYRTATAGETIWLSCKDTKLLDGDYTNMVVSDAFCGIASTYCALEIKHGITEKYIRPFSLTTNVLGLNNTGFNTIYDDTVYHGFDGQGYRIVSWVGNSGMNKEFQTLQYNYVANDRFKRSNKLPPNQFLGNFKTDPLCVLTALGEDTVDTIITQPSENTGVSVGSAGEDKDALRYAIPVCVEPISYLPAVVKTVSSYELAVIDGITSLCTDIRNTQTKYKTNVSIDFILNGKLYRYCDEYICAVTNKNGAIVLDKVVPCIGLKYLGASPYEAYFYNKDTRQLYSYNGGANLQVISMLERFRDIKQSVYNFIDQTLTIITIDNEPLVVSRNVFVYNIAKPLATIYNETSGYKTISIATGLTYQGPNRCIINRFIYNDYMHDSIRDNLGKWKKVPRNRYDMYPTRIYETQFENVTVPVESSLLGWTHNPFILQTAPLGIDEQTDALFEWTITFAWTETLERVYKQDEYACVNICAISYAPGAQLTSDVTHIYLTRELFGKANVGYYSFKFISNNGACNRESLCIWSDSIIALSELTVTVKPVTNKRTEILTQQIDVQDYKEL